MPNLTRDGDVFVLDLGADENRFNPTWVAGVNAALDEVEAAEGPRALVTTASGKFWSNGLDLAWIGEHAEEAQAFIDDVHELFARTLLLGVPTVAAIQGHCFAAGAMLAQAHDVRLMRSDRGFWCTPEVDIFIPFTEGMTALLMARLPRTTAHEAMAFGLRYGGSDAQAAGIVQAACSEAELLPTAIERAAALAGKDARTLGRIKERMYGDVAAALRDRSKNRLGE